MKKDLDRMVRTLQREHGCSVTHSGSGHLKIRGPNGGLVISARTPSSYRGVLNFQRDVRVNLGIDLREKS